MQRWRMGSGMRSQRRPCIAPGGSEVRKARKSSCANSSTISRPRSSSLSQSCIKWMFWSMIQPPPCADLLRASIATFSWPCPMEMFTSLPLDSRKPFWRPKASMVEVGSTPGKSTKKNGVKLEDSSWHLSMSKGSCSTYSAPKFAVINSVSAAPIRSGRMMRSKKRRWKGPRSRTLRGRSAVSAFSSVYQRFQPRPSCSKLSVSLPPFLKASRLSKVFICPHCVSVSQDLAFSGIAPADGSGGALMRTDRSSIVTWPARTRILMAIMDTTVSLSASRSPRRV
mmetsp:Transcript_146756/g.471053  ORF Transcript_146756/g.471053 Transcript_146756/m.471053 type:complete len:282 (-) Transcript_146756:10425-11270(-)